MGYRTEGASRASYCIPAIVTRWRVHATCPTPSARTAPEHFQRSLNPAGGKPYGGQKPRFPPRPRGRRPQTRPLSPLGVKAELTGCTFSCQIRPAVAQFRPDSDPRLPANPTILRVLSRRLHVAYSTRLGLRELGDDWSLDLNGHLRRGWFFPGFRGALAFTNQVGALAEAENHHPEIELGWGRVVVSVWTHAIGGLSRNDFILAAKISELTTEKPG